MEDEIETEPLNTGSDVSIALQEITECFSLFDKHHIGKMPSKHFEHAARALGIHLTSTEIKDVLDEIEKNGEILFEDFRDFAIPKITEPEEFDQLKRAFAIFDPDNEGIIPTDRFKKWMTNLGDKLTESEAKELAKLGDAAGKGIIEYDDLIAILVSEK